MASSRLYYDPAKPTAFSTLNKLDAAAVKKTTNMNKKNLRGWLEKQDPYILHRPIRRRFARNPYSVNNVMDVWKCDLVDDRAVAKFNNKYKLILSVIDVFSKFLYLIPLRSKTGTVVASAFQSIFMDQKQRRRPIWVRTDKGKEFLNKNFQEMLKREGIQFQVCKNPDVKYSVAERSHGAVSSDRFRRPRDMEEDGGPKRT